MAITKCPIPVPTVNEFTPSLRAARKCARTSDHVMETIMSKTNHASYGAAATSERELTEDDLALVSGGKDTPKLLEYFSKGKVFTTVETRHRWPPLKRQLEQAHEQDHCNQHRCNERANTRTNGG
jgi:hypothetical protein